MLNDVKDFRTVRITFRKYGRARYISHLDLNRTMTRAVRRAGLPIWYTEGFNRHPYITFASPLSLGYEGERETMDLRLESEMDMQELSERLHAVMPEGLAVIGAAWAIQKAKEVDRAVYRIHTNCTVDEVCALLSQPSIVVMKRTKKKEMKELELKSVLDASQPIVTPSDEGSVLELTLPCNSTDTVNPSLIVSALHNVLKREIISRICRVAVLDRDGKIFA